MERRQNLASLKDSQLADLQSLQGDSTTTDVSESNESSDSDAKSMESDLGVDLGASESAIEAKRVPRKRKLNASDGFGLSSKSGENERKINAKASNGDSPSSEYEYEYTSDYDSDYDSEDSARNKKALKPVQLKPRSSTVMEYSLSPYRHYEHTFFKVVVDYQNVAMSYGKNKKFICRGIELCIQYWKSKGFSVVGFVPRYLLKEDGKRGKEKNYDVEDSDSKKNAKKNSGKKPTKNSQKDSPMDSSNDQKKNRPKDPAKDPDDREYLNRLLDEGLIFQCPPQDYDDSYAIDYLKRIPSVIVSNDLFRDHMQRHSQQEKRFIKAHLISYTWAGDEFMPNPQFNWDNMIRASYS